MLNRKQSIALLLICLQLDRMQRDEGDVEQLLEFIGREGGTGKSRVIEAVVELFANKGISNRLLVAATSGLQQRGSVASQSTRPVTHRLG